MAKRPIPQINVPIMTANGSMELAWYLFLQRLNENSNNIVGIDRNIDGGFANSVYLETQKIDGGNANG